MATGAAFAGATLEVIDKRGVTVCSITIDATGQYTCELPAETQVPLVLRAERDDQTLYSVSANTEGTVNVTPLTSVIAAQLSPNGDASALANSVQSGSVSLDVSTIQTQVDRLMTALAPLLQALGEVGMNPIGGTFATDGTGQDRVLDSLSVSIRPDGTAANVELTVKIPTSSDAPMSLALRTSDSALPTLPPINSDALNDVPTPALVADLMSRITACFALPLTQRVSTATSDTQDATGTASDVSAPACRTLFLNDDPSSYSHNGATVRRTTTGNGAWNSLFRVNPTGTVYDRGNFEYLVTTNSGDKNLVLTYRWSDTFGNSDVGTLLVRNVNGSLKMVGNGRTYQASVQPISEYREYLNMPEYNAYITAYNINIDNRLNTSGQPLLQYVNVTSPWGTTYRFTPATGRSSLVLNHESGGSYSPTNSGVLRLATSYANPATPGNLAEKELGAYYLPTQLTESQISALQDQSVWKLEFVPVAGPTETQTLRTLSRPQTLNEIKQSKFAELTPAMRTHLLTATADPTNLGGRIWFGPTNGPSPNRIHVRPQDGSDAWVVPAGALAPTEVTAFGRTGGQGTDTFTDSVSVRSTQRSATIQCTPQGVSDPHCTTDPAHPNVLQYVNGANFNALHFWSRSSRMLEMKRHIAMYKQF